MSYQYFVILKYLLRSKINKYKTISKREKIGSYIFLFLFLVFLVAFCFISYFKYYSILNNHGSELSLYFVKVQLISLFALIFCLHLINLFSFKDSINIMLSRLPLAYSSLAAFEILRFIYGIRKFFIVVLLILLLLLFTVKSLTLASVLVSIVSLFLFFIIYANLILIIQQYLKRKFTTFSFKYNFFAFFLIGIFLFLTGLFIVQLIYFPKTNLDLHLNVYKYIVYAPTSWLISVPLAVSSGYYLHSFGYVIFMSILGFTLFLFLKKDITKHGIAFKLVRGQLINIKLKILKMVSIKILGSKQGALVFKDTLFFIRNTNWFIIAILLIILFGGFAVGIGKISTDLLQNYIFLIYVLFAIISVFSAIGLNFLKFLCPPENPLMKQLPLLHSSYIKSKLIVGFLAVALIISIIVGIAFFFLRYHITTVIIDIVLINIVVFIAYLMLTSLFFLGSYDSTEHTERKIKLTLIILFLSFLISGFLNNIFVYLGLVLFWSLITGKIYILSLKKNLNNHLNQRT